MEKLKHLFFVILLLGINGMVKAAFAPTAGTKYHIVQSVASSNKAVGNTSGQPSLRFVSTSTAQKFVFEATGETDTYYIKNDSNQYISNSTSTNLTYVASTNGNYSKWVIVGSAATALNFKNVQTNAYLTSANTNNGTALTASTATVNTNAAFKLLVSSTIIANGLIDAGFENAGAEVAPLGEWINDRGVALGGSGTSRATISTYKTTGSACFFIRYLSDSPSYGRVGHKLNDLIPGATYTFSFKYKQNSIEAKARACIYAASTALADSTAAIDGVFTNTSLPSTTADTQSAATSTITFVAPATSCYIVFKKWGAAYNTLATYYNLYIDDMSLTKAADPTSDNSTLSADFESSSFYSNTPINKTVGGGDSESLTIVTNPDATGINTTSKCVAAVRTNTGTSSFSAQFNIPPVKISGTKYLHVMVWKPKQSKMSVNFKNNTDGTIYTANNKYYVSTESAWVDAVFEVPSNISMYASRLAINLDLLAASGRYTQNTNTYFDEVLLNSDPLPRGVVSTPLKSPSLPENFEGSNTIVDPLYFGSLYYWKNGGINNDTPTDAIVSNPAKNSVNETNNALKMMYRSTFSWDSWLQVELNQGAGMTVGASNKYLHIMVNKDRDAEFAITTRVGNTESGWVRATAPDYAKANGWQDLVFLIPAGNYGLINRLSINGHTTGPGASDLPVYIDEIEFSSSATPRTIFNVTKTYDFGAQAINGTYTYSLPITAGALLNGDLTISMSGSSDFSTTTTTLTQAQITAGTIINLTYIPTTLGAKTGTLSIMSNGVTLAQVGIAGVGGDPNEAIYIDFESSAFFATTPANIMNGGVGDALTIVDNPSKTGLNSSNKAAMGVRSASGTATFQAEFNIEPTVINTTRYLHVYVNKPTHASMTLNGRNNYPVSGNSWDNVYSANHLYYTKGINEWVDVVFKITGNGNKIDRLILGLDNFSPAGRYASNSNFYFDQILLNDDPNPRGATLTTKKTTFPEDFEGSSYVGDPTYFPTTYSWITNSTHANSAIAYESVVANPLVSSVNNSSKAFKTTQTATNSAYWTRIQFELNNGLGTTIGAGNKYFHVMMYKTGSGGEVKAFFIRTDNAQQEWINPTAVYAYAGWQDMVFEVPAAVYGDIKNVAILPYGGNATDVDVYFDNIEFSASSTPRTSVATFATNYFRSVGSGSWDNLANWESSSDNSYWIPATALPTSQATAVDINPATQITMPTGTTLAPVTVKAGGKLTLNNNVILNGVTLQSDATGTATFVDTNNDSPQSVTATVQQHLTAERNWYTASPIATGTAAGLSLGTSVQTYSESSKGWTILASTDELVAGKGYVSVATTGTGTTGTVSFSGVLNTGTIPVAVTRSGTDKAGFNLVANPYPSYLDWTLVTADPLNANIGTSMWFRTKTAANAYIFSTYNSDGNVAVANSAATSITKYIPPMQAFWIRVNSGTASTNLTFKNTMRSHRDVNGNTLKAPIADNQKLVRLQVSNGTNSDEAVVYFDANAQNGFDTYDSQKMFNNSNVQPEIYSIIGNEQLVINGLSESALNSEQLIGFNAGESTDYSIAVTELKNFDGKVYLKDKLLKNEVELTGNTVYPFSSGSVKSTDRFSLIFRTAGSTTALDAQAADRNVTVFVSALKNIEVKCTKTDNSILKLYNLTGELLYQAPVVAGNHTIQQKLNAGVYLVSVSGNGNTITKRVIIH